MRDEGAVVGDQVVRLGAPARRKHEVVLKVPMDAQVLIGQPHIRDVRANRRRQVAHVAHAPERRPLCRLRRGLVQRPELEPHGTLELALQHIERVVTITPKNLTVKNVGVNNKPYDGNEDATLNGESQPVLEGVVGSDSVTFNKDSLEAQFRAKDGAPAGTANMGLRAEAIDVVVLPKGAAAPSSTANAYRSK